MGLGCEKKGGIEKKSEKKGNEKERGRLRNGAEIYGVLRRPWGPTKKDVLVRKEVVGVPQEQT